MDALSGRDINPQGSHNIFPRLCHFVPSVSQIWGWSRACFNAKLLRHKCLFCHLRVPDCNQSSEISWKMHGARVTLSNVSEGREQSGVCTPSRAVSCLVTSRAEPVCRGRCRLTICQHYNTVYFQLHRGHSKSPAEQDKAIQPVVSVVQFLRVRN